jgi:CubicO group peptidase (beta-lactamase class C family)
MTAQTAAKQAATPQTPSLPQAKPESLGLSSVRLQRMSDAFKRDIDKGTIPGVTVMVARRGQIGWFDALGRQNPASSAPMAHNSIFRIFSMTKPIVSVGIMMLLEEGHLLLDDAIAKYIPEFSDQKVGVENNGKLDLIRGRSRSRICCGTPRASPTTTPATAWCNSCISSRGCAAARSPTPNTPHWSRACP